MIGGVPDLLVTSVESGYCGDCGSTALGFSCAGTCQISDQSRAIGKSRRNNNYLKVNTPNSFIHLLYNCPCIDKVNVHNITSTPSVSVLMGKTMEAS